MKEKISKNKRMYSEQVKRDAVQMLAGGHRAKQIVKDLGISCPKLLYTWRSKFINQAKQADKFLMLKGL